MNKSFMNQDIMDIMLQKSREDTVKNIAELSKYLKILISKKEPSEAEHTAALIRVISIMGAVDKLITVVLNLQKRVKVLEETRRLPRFGKN